MHGEGDEPTPSNPGGPVPATDDEIREKYLERAIREMNALTHDVQGCRHCPRGNLMPVLGSGHPQADVLLLKYAPQVAEIKRQGGLVYVPHPFDRMHSVPDYEHLLTIIEDIDLIEIFNPRVAIGSFNEEAERFAQKYRIPAGAGSDAHVAQGLGTARVRMRDFDGPQEFLESIRDAEIITTPTNYVYVQALKFLQTKATPQGARAGVRQRRVRRAARKP